MKKEKQKRRLKILSNLIFWLLIFISIVLITGANYIKDTFGNVSVEEIIFNIKVPLKGTEMTSVNNYFKGPFLYSLIISLIILLILFYNSKLKVKFNLKFKKKELKFIIFPFKRLIGIIFIIIILPTSILYFIYKLDVDDYIKNQISKSNLIEDEYVDPRNTKIKFPDKKRNLIYIYLESMEASYTSVENGGIQGNNLIEGLTNLANENISFSNTEKLGGALSVPGTTWTVGGMVAQTAGLPLKLSIGGNDYGNFNTFLPGAYTIGDILKDNGYNQEIIMGSYASFSGRDHYFTQHGNYKIFDFDYAVKNNYMKEKDKVWWGFEDKDLFEWSKDELTKISKEDKPFNFTILTADTHFEDGYLSDSCNPKYDDQYSSVISCSSDMVYDFVKWVMDQDFYENTAIVMSGDHITMDKDFFKDIDKNYQRSIYNVFINSKVEPINKNNRVFTTMDLFPSTLAAIGANLESNRLGIGTNLFSNEKTVAEKYGIKKFREELDKTSNFYDKKFLYQDK